MPGELPPRATGTPLHPLQGRHRTLLRDLPFPQFVQRLAIDAKRRGGSGLEPFQADLHAAAFAITVFAPVDLADGFVDFLDQLAFAVTVAQFQGNVGFLAGTIIGVGEHGRLILHGVHCAVDILRQLDFELIEDFPEMLELLRAHVLLALFRHVRLEVGVEFGGHFLQVLVRKSAL